MSNPSSRKASAPPAINIPIVHQNGSENPTASNAANTVKSHLNASKPAGQGGPGQGSMRHASLNDRLKEMNAKATQLISAHKNALPGGGGSGSGSPKCGRSISLGSAATPRVTSSGFCREKSPTIVEIPPSPVKKENPDNPTTADSFMRLSSSSPILGNSVGGGNDVDQLTSRSLSLLSPHAGNATTSTSSEARNNATDNKKSISNSGGGGGGLGALMLSPKAALKKFPSEACKNGGLWSSSNKKQDCSATGAASFVSHHRHHHQQEEQLVSSSSTSSLSGLTGSAATRQSSSVMSSSSKKESLVVASAAEARKQFAQLRQGSGGGSADGIDGAADLHDSMAASVHQVISSESQSVSSTKSSSAGGVASGSSFAKETTHTTHTSHKKSSVTMRSRLCRRPSILSTIEVT